MKLTELTERMLQKYDSEWKESGESESATSLNKTVIKDLTDSYAEGLHDAKAGKLKQDNRQIQIDAALQAMNQCNTNVNKDRCHDWFKLYFNQRHEMYQMGYENGLINN